MLAAKTACNYTSGATFHLAHFGATTTMLDTPSSCIDGRGAAEVIAEPVGAMLKAESTSFNSCIAPFSRSDLLSIVLPAKASYNSVAAAAFSRTLHFGGMMQTNTPFSLACVSDARIHCADPKSAMLHADKLPKNLRSVTAWSSAG